MTANPDRVASGERVYYVLTVSNPTGSTLVSVELDAQLPDYMRVYNTETTGGGVCVGVSSYCDPGDVMRWQLGDLAPGEVRTVQMAPLLYHGPPADGTVLRSEATVSYGGGTATTARDVVVDSTPALALSLVEERDPVGPGGLLSYRLRVRNLDSLEVTNVDLVITVPVGTTLTAAPDGGLLQGDEVHWSLGTLAAGGEVERRLTVEVEPGAGDGTLLVAQAEASGVMNGVAVAARGNAVTAVQAAPALSLNMTTNPER